MNEKKLFLLDASAMPAYLNREDGYQTVRELLRQARRSDVEVALSELNLGEIYYVLVSRKGRDLGARLFASLQALPIGRLPVDFETILRGAEFRAAARASFADCIAVATALRVGATLVTRDPDFRQFEPPLKVRWL